VEISKVQLLRNPAIEPTDNVIAKALGSAHAAYAEFIKKLGSLDIELKWRYYTDGKAWLAKGLYQRTGSRGGQKETTVFWLSVWEGFFKVTIYFPENTRADVLRLPLGGKIKRMIADSNRMGKMKFFPVVLELCSDEMFDWVLLLADFKKNMK
jgi:hypothetical protein